jgi:antitoxin (DNA-binding transcriptional repressor) of toxin-antitoxin stability system
MIQANVAQVKARLSYYLRLASAGERVMICDRNKPVAELVPVQKPIDRELRASAFGMFVGMIDEREIEVALRPMSDEEAEAFIEGTY